MNRAHSYPLFVARDLDGLAALLVDNLVNLMIIAGTCIGVIGMPPALVYGKILPGAAVSLVVGNLYYAHAAAVLARRENRSDVTALPYGINTVTVFAFLFLILLPVARATGDPELAWKVGVAACVISGVVEILGAAVGDLVRRITPPSAMLAALAGVALAFIAMKPGVDIFGRPLVGLVPMGIILAAYLGGRRLPFGIPAGLVAVILGSILGWATGILDVEGLRSAAGATGLYLPSPAFGALVDGFSRVVPFLAVIVPTALMSVLGTLQCVHSAAEAGDRYATGMTMLVDGAGTLLGGLFGSCFPTSVYIGHPGYRDMGARRAYSILNAVCVSVLCLAGLVELALAMIPVQAVAGILLFIGVVIGSQAFTVSDPKHYGAVLVGFLPAFAAWGTGLVESTIGAAGADEASILSALKTSGVDLEALRALGSGCLLTSMLLSAALICVIDRKWRTAAYWCLAAAVASAVGLIHAPTIGFLAAPGPAIAYAACAALCFFVGLVRR